MTSQHTMSPDLIAFLKAWYDWATNGAPEDEPYSRFYGLCGNAERHFRDEESPHYDPHHTAWELNDALGSKAFPFGWPDYSARHGLGTQHECPKRLAWVRERLVEAGELAA